MNNTQFDSPEKKTMEEKQEKQAFTPVRTRTYFIGAIAVVAVCVVVALAELVASKGGSIDAILLGATHMPPGAIGVLIALLLMNAMVAKISRKIKLNSAEMAVIYFMLGSGAVLSSFGMVGVLLPQLMSLNYMANPQDHAWRDMFFSHIPKWLVPWDPAGAEGQRVAVSFFERLKPGEKIPWDAWIGPLLFWLIFAFFLFLLMACVATLFRKQWVDNEKLTFPLVQLPMEMVNDESGQGFFRNKAMWLGLLIPVAFYMLNGVSKSVPSVPSIPTSFNLVQLFSTRPMNEMIFTPLVLSFSIIGFSYLLPLDVSFSMWFFLLFFRFQDFLGLSMGYTLDNHSIYGGARYYQAYQSAGAFVAIALSMIWLARPHLKLVAKKIFSNDKSDVDENEFMSYRSVFWVGLISYILVVFWLYMAGMTVFVAAFVVLSFVMFVMLVLTRCTAEVGLLMLQPVFRPLDLWAVFAPKASMGAQNLTILSMVQGSFMRDPRGVMPIFMDSMKGADLVKAKRKKMLIGAIIAVLVGVLAAYIIQVYLAYTYGGMHLNRWFYQDNTKIAINEAEGIIKGRVPFDFRSPVCFAIGLAFTFFLYAMRAQFWWWPFHPLGYALGPAWPSVVYWSSFFVGWLLKSVILRYGGARIYRTFRPFFLGLILGEFAMGILWALLSYVFGLLSPAIPIS